MPDVLSALGDAKAQAEGRALRVQKCAPLKGSRVLEELNSKFEDARSPYNGRIDAWIFVLRNRGSVKIEDAIEPENVVYLCDEASDVLSDFDPKLTGS